MSPTSTPLPYRLRVTPDGAVTVNDHPIDTTGAPSPQAAGVTWLAARAREHRHPVRVRAVDPDGTTVALVVHADGHSTLDPHPTPTDPTATPGPTAADETADAGVVAAAEAIEEDPADGADPSLAGGLRGNIRYLPTKDNLDDHVDENESDDEDRELFVTDPATDTARPGDPAEPRRADRLPGDDQAPSVTGPDPATDLGTASSPAAAALSPAAAQMTRTQPGVPPLGAAGLLPRLRPTTARPTQGWPARIHRWTRGRITPPPTAAERAHLALTAAVQTRLDGPRTVVVVNPKGGAGKTPATMCVAATYGAHRGAALAWDDNETRGTLRMRGLADPGGGSVWNLVEDLHRFEAPTARLGDLTRYLHPQGDARFDVLASDADPARMAQIGAAEFDRLRQVLHRFYALTVIDTGNNVRSDNWQAAVDAADSLLLVSTYQRDAAVTASWTLDHLHATGRGHLADTAVTVLSAATPSTDRRTRTELRDHFTARTRTVVEVPYDPVIADGDHLDLAALRPATRNAWLQVTAALTDGLTR